MASFWRVVGGKDGGIKVREGHETTSRELPERLSTGSLLQELELQGDRLHYRALSGTGPLSGWVSIKLSGGKDLVTRTPEGNGTAPLLVVLPSGGMTTSQGQDQMRPFLDSAAGAGFKEQLVLSHFPDPPYDTCRDWNELCDRLTETIDEEPHRRGLPVVLVCHSLGCNRGYGVAKRLGERCLKFYAVASRPPTLSSGEEVFDVSNYDELAQLEDSEILKRCVGAWASSFWLGFKDKAPEKWPPIVKASLENFRKQYASPCTPIFKENNDCLQVGGMQIAAPILAIAGSQELPKGETPEKFAGYADLTLSSFQLEVVEAGHFDCMSSVTRGKSSPKTLPVWDIIIKDMRQFVQSGPASEEGAITEPSRGNSARQ